MVEVNSEVTSLFSKVNFLKVKCDYFEIGQVKFTFVHVLTKEEQEAESEKAKKENRQSKTVENIDCCLSFSEAGELAISILQGRIKRPAGQEDAWKSGIGGVHEEDAKRRGLRTDGLAVARWFAIQSANAGWARFTAFQTGGKTSPEGLIVPEKNIAKIAITVPIPTETKLRQMAVEILMALNAYQAARYMCGWESFMQELAGKRQKTQQTERPVKPEAERELITCDCFYAEKKGSFYELRGAKADAHVFRMVVPIVSADDPGILASDQKWQMADVVIYARYLDKDYDRSGEFLTAIEKAGNGIKSFHIKNLPLIVGEVRDGYRQLIYTA